MKLIILSITPYKEKDGIVTAISEDSVISFSVRSILDPKSPNHILNNPLIEVDVTFLEGKHKYNVLKSAKVISSPYTMSDSLEKLATISLLQEATRTLLNEEEQILMFGSLKQCLEGLKNTNNSVYHIALNYLFKILKISGNELELGGCVFCNSKKEIKGLSFADGGLVCKNCIDEKFYSDIPLENIMLFRKCMLIEDYNTHIDGLDDEIGLFFLKKIVSFIYSSLGVTLKSIKLF